MKSSSGYATLAGGYKQFFINWQPDGAVKGIILLTHGYAEHIGRYEDTAHHFTSAGFAVYGGDYPGHGKSDGLSVYFESFDAMADTLDHLLQTAKIDHPNLPIFILGHSMGTLTAIDGALRHQAELKGLILSASTLTAHKTAPDTILKILPLLDRLIPKMRVSRPIVPENLSKDPAIVEAYRNDPLISLGKWRTRTGFVVYKAILRLREEVKGLTLPILILHGEADSEVPPSGSQYTFDHVQSKDKTLKFYPGVYHELLNDLEKEEVFADILAWLDRHL